MAIAETAKLMSSLELDTRKFDAGVVKANRGLKSMESTAFKVGEGIGRGLNRAAHNLKRIAQVGVVSLVGAVALGVKSLGDLQRTENQTAAVIESTGGKAKVSAQQVRDYAENLETLSTVDDKVIQDGENMLLTFTNIGSKVFPQATKAALDMAVAMAGGNVEAVDLKSSAIQLGKALNDPVKGIGALAKVGVSFTDVQKKTIAQNAVLSKAETKHYLQLKKTNKASAERYKAGVLNNKLIASQKIILAELNTEFGKASEAAGKGPEAVMRRLADAGEDVSQILARATLPVLERLGKFLTDKLNDKGFLKAVDEFGTELGIAGGKFLDFIEKVDFTAIGNALKTGAGFAKDIIGAFLSAPTWLQEAIVTGWGLNKLTGGAVTDIFGTLASGLIKGVLGMNAGVVNINAGTVVGGGGGIPTPGGAAAKGLSGIAKVALVSEAIGLALLVNEVRTGISEESTKQAQAIQDQTAKFIATQPSRDALTNSLAGIDQGIHDLESNPLNVLVQGEALDKLRGMRADVAKALAAPPSIETHQTGDKSKPVVQSTASLQDSFDRAVIPTKKAIDQTTGAVDTLKGKIADDLDQTKVYLAAAAGKTTNATTAGAQRVTAAEYAGANIVASAVRSSQPIVNTYVNVSSTTVDKTTTVIKRYGSIGGDRVQGGSGVTHNGAD